MKIKQIELKDVNLETLNQEEVYVCDLDGFYIQDLYFETIHSVLERLRKNKPIVFFKVEKEMNDD